MRHHIAILHQRYLKLILNGTKTIESRISKSRHAPWGRINAGDLIHFKQSSGPFMAQALAVKVHSFDHLTPEKLQRLQKRFSARTLGPQAYWTSKQHCQYATFIELAHVTPTTDGPSFPRSYGQAWFVLDTQTQQQNDHAPGVTSPLQTILTAGALKNRYLLAPASLHQGNLTLHLPDDQILSTHITPQRRFASRQWTSYFKTLRPGDVARFVPQGNRRYRVTFMPASNQTQPKDH